MGVTAADRRQDAAGVPCFSSRRPSRIVRSISFDCSRYQLPSSNSIAGYELCPVPAITAVRLLLPGQGPLTTSYSIPSSSSAFCTLQHGCPPSFAHMLGQRCSFRAIASSPLARSRRDHPIALRREAREGVRRHVVDSDPTPRLVSPRPLSTCLWLALSARGGGHLDPAGATRRPRIDRPRRPCRVRASPRRGPPPRRAHPRLGQLRPFARPSPRGLNRCDRARFSYIRPDSGRIAIRAPEPL